MNGEELCQRCSEEEAVVFTFETPKKTFNLCKGCWREVSYYRQGCFRPYYAGPVVYDIKSKAVLNRVSKEKDLKVALSKRKTAIRLVKHLLQVSKTVHESLLSYFEAEEETNTVKAQIILRYDQVTAALGKLISSWKTYDFWTHPPSPLGHMIFTHRKGFLFLLFKQVLLYPSLLFEIYLKPEFVKGLSREECFDLIVRGLTKEEKTRLIAGFDLVIVQETNREDQIALERSSGFLREHLSHPRFLHLDRSLESLISEELEVGETTYQEEVSRLISSSWRTASIQLTGCLYWRHYQSFRDLEDIEAAARFMCKFFPWHQYALEFCTLMRKKNSSGDFGLCVKLMLTAQCYQGSSQYSLRQLYEAARIYADLEVSVIHAHVSRMIYGEKRLKEMREIYRK